MDALLSPAATDLPPMGLASSGSPVMSVPRTHAGLPALRLPAAGPDELPPGLQAAGASGGATALPEAGMWLEEVPVG